MDQILPKGYLRTTWKQQNSLLCSFSFVIQVQIKVEQGNQLTWKLHRNHLVTSLRPLGDYHATLGSKFKLAMDCGPRALPDIQNWPFLCYWSHFIQQYDKLPTDFALGLQPLASFRTSQEQPASLWLNGIHRSIYPRRQLPWSNS